MDEKNILAAILTVAYYAGGGPHEFAEQNVVEEYRKFRELLKVVEMKPTH